jgi:hypothetical protein
MKYRIFAFLILVTVNVNYGQLINNFGLKLGVSYSDVEQKYLQMGMNDNTKFKYGLSLSLFVRSALVTNLSLISEFGYIQKGYQEEFIAANMYGEEIGTVTYKDRFDYLTLKLLPAYEYSFGTISPYLFIGPKIDFKIMTVKDYSSLFKDLRDTQLGLSYGIGLKLNNIFNYALFIEINSNYDFEEILKNDFVKFRNISYEIKAGIEF